MAAALFSVLSGPALVCLTSPVLLSVGNPHCCNSDPATAHTMSQPCSLENHTSKINFSLVSLSYDGTKRVSGDSLFTRGCKANHPCCHQYSPRGDSVRGSGLLAAHPCLSPVVLFGPLGWLTELIFICPSLLLFPGSMGLVTVKEYARGKLTV